MKKITICSVVVCLCLLNGGRAQAADAVAPGLGLVAAAHAKPAKTHQVKPDKAKNAKFGKASKGHSGSGASQAQTGKPAKRAKREPLPPASPDLPQSGIASWVGPYFKDRPVAVPGERYIMEGFTAAHRAVAFHSILKVTDLDSGRSVLVRVNDRGPYIAGRIIDLAKGAAEYLGFVYRGIANVRLELVGNVKDPAQRYYIRMRPSAGAGRAGLVQGFGPFEKFDEAAALLASLYKHYPDAELLTVREQG